MSAALFLLVALLALARPSTGEFSFYSTKGDFSIFWDVDTENSELLVHLSWPSAIGFVRLALSAPATPGRQDVWTASTSSNGLTRLFDQISLAGANPVNDAKMNPPGSSDLSFRPSPSVSSGAIVAFTRKLLTADSSYDTPITNTALNIQWSYGSAPCIESTGVCPAPTASGQGTINFMTGSISGGSMIQPGAPTNTEVDKNSPFYGSGKEGELSYEYSIDKDFRWLTMKMSAPVTGYISMGIGKTISSMTGADYWIGGVIEDATPNVVYLVDVFSPNNINPVLDTDNRGLDDLKSPLPTGSQVNGVTTINFVRPLVTRDPSNDIAIERSESLVHVAWHSSDCSTGSCPAHRACAASTPQSGCSAFKLNWATGSASAATKGLDPSQILLLISFAAFCLFLLFRYGRKIYKCSNGQFKKDREMLAAKHDEKNLYFVSDANGNRGVGPSDSKIIITEEAGKGKPAEQTVDNSLGTSKDFATGPGALTPDSRPRFSVAPKAMNDSSSTVARWVSKWILMKAENGVPYYYNPELQQTAWTIPPLPDYEMEAELANELADKPSESDGKSPPSIVTAATKSLWAKQSHSAIFTQCQSLFQCRIPFTQIHFGTIFLVAAYLAVNFFCLVMVNEKEFPWEDGFGYLTLGNSLLIMIPASRNSIFVWLFGFPFDRIIAFHRRIGLLTFALLIAHFVLYIEKWQKENAEAGDGAVSVSDRLLGITENRWGFISFLSICGIFLFSLPWIRRKWFELFYFSHYLFLLYFLGIFYHIPLIARPYIAAIIIFYGLDRLIRLFWGLLPIRTERICIKSDNLIQITFRKHYVARKLKLFKPGQYVFLNFPGVSPPGSCFQWFPFTLTSGPDEENGEVHIRALGNHTKALLKHCQKIAERVENFQIVPNFLIRVDGPYGNLRLNYRRFPTVALFAGGIGITPIISLLKDIYQCGHQLSSINHYSSLHSMENVFLIWIIPYEHQFLWFSQEFDEFSKIAQLNRKLFPQFHMWIYITRPTGGKDGKLTAAAAGGEEKSMEMVENPSKSPERQLEEGKLGKSVTFPSKLAETDKKKDEEIIPEEEEKKANHHSSGEKAEESSSLNLPPEIVQQFSREVFQVGRPDLDSIANSIRAEAPNVSEFYFACGSEPLVNDVWDCANRQRRAGNRVDFHHEIFNW